MFGFLQSLMGFFRKEKNGKGRKRRGNRKVRRVANPERLPLDMKPDTPKIRQKKKDELRRKLLRTALIVGTGVSLVALGNTAMQETLFKNPRFSLRQVYVDTTGILTPTRIIGATGLVEGVNLLTVNLRDVRERVQHLPGVRNATVQRDFDGKLTITVEQRKPIAWVKCDYMHWMPRRPVQGMLVDADGITIPADTITEELHALPEINDDAIRQGDPGCAITAPRFLAALKLTKELLKRQEQGGARLKSVEAAKKFALVASFHDGATTTFSIDDFTPQLQRYDAVYVQSREQKLDIERLNVISDHVAPIAMKTVLPVQDLDLDLDRGLAKPKPAPSPTSTAKSSSAKAKNTKSKSSTPVAHRTRSSSR